MLVPNQMFRVMYVGIQIIWSVVTGFLPRSLSANPPSGYGDRAVGLGDAFGRPFTV